ncbi:MAG TPA: LTA synthase family protein, partial [Clostridia bacterium]|nr:LTA synthase family protein [Clostridia bacterium]
LGSLGDSISNLLRIKDIIFVIDFPVLIAGIIFLHKKGMYSMTIIKRLVISVLMIAIGTVSFFTAYSHVQKSMFHFDKNYIIKSLGILQFHADDLETFIKEDLFSSDSPTAAEKKVVDSFFKTKVKEGNSLNGIAKGKNLIILQSEALQSFLINLKVNGVEVTPNINKLMKESVSFSNFYYQAARGKTSDAELLCNASLYPITDGSVYFKYPTRAYHSIANVLRDAGYAANSYHAYDPSFYNRTVAHRSLGFEKFYSKSDFKIDQIEGWGLSDESFYRQVLDKLDKSKPSYSFLISLSSHYPFNQYQDFSFDVGSLNKTLLGNYIKAENYADKCVGVLIDELKKRGLYDNTVFVLYGDHYGIPLDVGKPLLKYLNLPDNELEWAKLQKVPFIIHYPGLKNGETMSITGGQIDILPTLANLMGVKSQYALGKDLFNTSKGYVVFRDGSVFTDKYFYISNANKVFDVKTGGILNKNSIMSDLAKYQHELTVSDIIIKKNAFKK